MPLAAMMGVDWEDAGRVASLIGTKIFVSEFVAYAELGPLIKEGIISVSFKKYSELVNKSG